jgi:hypothetical protein
MELSTPRLVRSKSGKIGVESKKEMRSRGVKSPNWADMLAYLFSDTCSDVSVIDTLKYKDSVIYSSEDYDPLKSYSQPIGSIVVRKDGSIYILVSCYDYKYAKFFIIKEFEYKSFNDSFIVALEAKNLRDYKKIRWFCGEDILDEVKKGQNSIYYKFNRLGIYPMSMSTFNLVNNIDYIKKLFHDGNIAISKECEYLSAHLRNWKVRSGVPETDLFAANGLLLLVSGKNDHCN